MISVIGGGPAGCFYASQEKHDDVHLFENHKEIGKPVSCTGILTGSIETILDIPKELIVSSIKRFKIISPSGESVYIPLKSHNPIVDRGRFDSWIYEKAVDNGVKMHLGERFLGYRNEGDKYVVKTSKQEYETGMIVGADGPHSPVARAAGIFENRKFVSGWQARCSYPELEEGTTEIRLGLGEFCWIVPEDDKIARVGVIGKPTPELRQEYKKLLGANKILEDQSGPIPIYNPKQQLRKGNIFLIGDAASQVKPTTYGGIIYGLIAARHLAKNKDTYPKKFRNISRELKLSLLIRKAMNSMSSKQLDSLVSISGEKRNLDILSKHDRNYPSKFIMPLLLKNPGLWWLGLGTLKNMLLKSR